MGCRECQESIRCKRTRPKHSVGCCFAREAIPARIARSSLGVLSFLLALIGTGSTTEGEVDDVVDFHLQHPAFWSSKKHDRWARGSRVVAKVVGARLIALTGTLDCLQPEYDPLVEKDQRWDWRYDMRWDSRPARPVSASDLGPPFNGAIRSAQPITREDFRRAYRALHGRDPQRQIDEMP